MFCIVFFQLVTGGYRSVFLLNQLMNLNNEPYTVILLVLGQLAEPFIYKCFGKRFSYTNGCLMGWG